MGSELKVNVGAHVGAGEKSVQIFSVGLEGSQSAGHSTVFARDADGRMSVTSGPTEEIRSAYNVRIGSEEWHARIKQDEGTKTTRYEHVQFEAGERGDAASRPNGLPVPDRDR